jgi:hypothetical protein
MKRIVVAAIQTAALVAVFGITTASQASQLQITSVTLQDSAGTHVSSNYFDVTTRWTISTNTTLAGFTVSNNMNYSASDLILSTNVAGTAPNTPFQGTAATGAGTPAQAVTDNRIDTGANGVNGTTFMFQTAPLSLSHLLVVFELGNTGTADAPVLQLVDSSDGTLGSSVTLLSANWKALAKMDSTAAVWTFSLNGVALPLSDFGISVGDLSSVAGVKITTGNNVDPVLVGLAIPEPSALTLVGIGLIGAWLLGRRRRA